MFDNPKAVPDFGISDEFMKRVEKQIHEAPEYYLWTHKRWKTQGKIIPAPRSVRPAGPGPKAKTNG
jgi:uncharacterized membrane protein